MTDRLKQRIEGMSNILDSLNIKVESYDVVQQLVEEYDAGVSIEQEIEHYQHKNTFDYIDAYNKQKRIIIDLKGQLKMAENTCDIYRTHVDKQHKCKTEIRNGLIYESRR